VVPVSKPTALIVEDAPEFVALLVPTLEGEGFAVSVARTGRDGIALARELHPDLVVLDVTLPDVDGFEVCRVIRTFSDTYVVMVTGRREEIDKVLGLTVGADDYLTKPFNPRELSARITAMRRRPRAKRASTRREYGTLVVDVASREVRNDREIVDLTRIEFDIIAMLTAEPRRAFTRQELLDSVWGSSWYGDDHIIDVHIANLRKKLGEDGASPRHVKTVRNVGYRFDP
jgi:DNA-binding response OmpR family regulator